MSKKDDVSATNHTDMDFSEIVIPNQRSEHDILSDLEAVCTTPGYAHALAFLCWRENFFGYDQSLKPDDLHNFSSMERLLRTEISLLTRLMASAEIDTGFPGADNVERYIAETERLLSELHEAMNVHFFRSLKEQGLDSRNAGTDVRALSLREPIFYSGEAAFHFQYRDFSTLRYRFDTAWLQRNVGFSLDDVATFYDAIINLQQKKLNEIRTSTTIENIQHLTLLPAFIACFDEIASEAGLSIETVKCIVHAFSPDALPIGEPYRVIGAWNELSSRPIILIDKDSFVLLQAYCLAESAYESPFYWMIADKAYRNEASKNRGNFTEDFAASRLRHLFSADHVHQNVLIYDEAGETAGEIDVLVLYADRALVVQAKSKRLTEAARQGVAEALKSDFEKAVQAAYDQGFQCAEFLKTHRYRLVGRDGREITIKAELREIFLICLVADYFPGLPHYADELIVLKNDTIIREPYVIDIFLLDVVCELLETPLYLFSFLNKRHAYARKIHGSSEISILGYHLSHNLYFNDDMDFINLGEDFSAAVDAAMLVRRAGFPGERTPDGILTRNKGSYFDGLIDQLNALEDNNIIDLGYLLLSVSEEAARDISEAIRHISGKAQADRRVHDFSMAFDKTGFTVHCGWENDQDTFERICGHCGLSKHRAGADSWYGIALRPSPIGSLRLAVGVVGKWEPDPGLDQLVERLGTKPMHKNLRKAISVDGRKRKIGVNQPCPCGSGNKFKRCCQGKGFY